MIKLNSSTLHSSFALRSLLFVALLSASVQASNWAFRETFMHNHLLRLVEQQFIQAAPSIQILKLGDSYVGLSLDSRKFDHGFDYTSRGENYVEHYFKLKHVLKLGGKPRVIILPLDFQSFHKNKLDKLRNDIWYWKQIMSFSDFLTLSLEAKDQRIARARMIGIAEFTGATQITRKSGFLTKSMGLEMGFVTGMNPKPPLIPTRGDLKAMHSIENPNPILVRYFTKTLKLAEENGIHVILFEAPMSSALRKELDTVASPQEFDRRLRSLIPADSKAIVANYRDAMSDEFFYDASHLSTDGAGKFTERFIRETLSKL